MLKVEEIHELIKLIDESSIEEFTYEANGTKLAMKKPLHRGAAVAGQEKITEPSKELNELEKSEPIEDANVTQVVDTSTEKEVIRETAYDYEIKSPMVGTFYSSANPESKPFVNHGDSVHQDTVVCIVEAMKLFNEIEADVSGEIVEILVDNGELVEYGQPLFRVKTK